MLTYHDSVGEGAVPKKKKKSPSSVLVTADGTTDPGGRGLGHRPHSTAVTARPPPRRCSAPASQPPRPPARPEHRDAAVPEARPLPEATFPRSPGTLPAIPLTATPSLLPETPGAPGEPYNRGAGTAPASPWPARPPAYRCRRALPRPGSAPPRLFLFPAGSAARGPSRHLPLAGAEARPPSRGALPVPVPVPLPVPPPSAAGRRAPLPPPRPRGRLSPLVAFTAAGLEAAFGEGRLAGRLRRGASGPVWFGGAGAGRRRFNFRRRLEGPGPGPSRRRSGRSGGAAPPSCGEGPLGASPRPSPGWGGLWHGAQHTHEIS